MKRIQVPKPVYMCFLSIPLILLILIIFSFSLSSINHKYHNLIFSTYELIVVAKSSPAAVFVTCNVIIITIYLGSLKSPAGDSGQLFCLFPSVHETDGAKEEEKDGGLDASHDDDEEEEEEEEEEFLGYDGDNDDYVDEADADSEDEIDSSDLQMKIEEFIDKAYKKWKEEMVAERLLSIAATQFN